MPDIVERTVLAVDIDAQAAQRAVQGVARIRAEYDKLTARGQALDQSFKSQGAAANRLYAQIANLNEAYKAGRVTRERYITENARLNAELGKADRAFGATTMEIRQTDTALKEFYRTAASGQGAAAVTAQAQTITQRMGGLRRSAEAASGIGRAASFILPSGIATGAPGAALRALVGIQMLEAEFPKLTEKVLANRTALLGWGGALAIVGVAVYALIQLHNKQKEAAEQLKAALQASIDKQKEYYQFVQTATAQDVQERIAQTNDQIAAQKRVTASVKDNLAQVDALLARVSEFGRGVGHEVFFEKALLPVEIGGIEIKTVEGLQAAHEQFASSLDKESGILKSLQGDLSAYQGALNDSRVVINNVKEAIQTAWADLQASIAGQISARQGALTAARTWTLEQFDSYIQTLLDERQAILEVTGGSALYADRLKEISAAMDTYFQVVRPVISARDSENKAIKAQKDALENITDTYEAMTRSVKAEMDAMAGLAEDRADTLADLTAAERDYADETAQITADRARQAAEDEADFLLKRTRDIADHYADLADLDANYFEKRDDILAGLATDLGQIDTDRVEELQDLNRDLTDLAEDHADRMRDIAREADLDIQSAAMKLDAQGIVAAQRQRQEELRDEDEQYQKEKQRRERDYRDALQTIQKESAARQRAAAQALRDLDAQHNRERQAAIAAFGEKLRREDQDRTIETQRRAAQYAREDAARAAHYATEISGLQTHQGEVETEYAAHWQRMINIQRQSQHTIEAQTPIAQGLRLPTAYQAGGYPPVGQLVRVGERGPELARFLTPVRIYPHGQMPGGGPDMSGVNINIYVSGGGNPEQTAYMTVRAFERKMEQFARRQA